MYATTMTSVATPPANASWLKVDRSARFTSPASVRFDAASGRIARSPLSESSVPSPVNVAGSNRRTPSTASNFT